MQATDFNSWTTDDVCNWLNYVNLGQYQIAFRRAEIEGRHLSYVDNNFLITQLHITSMIQQQEIKRAVEGLIGGPAQSSTLITSARRRVVMDGKCEPLLNISAQALLHDKCRHSGWLKKLGAKVKNWKQRYHVLKNGCMYYFEQDTSQRAKGQFSLYNYRVERATTTEVRQFPWAYKLVNKEQSKRTWFFAASAQHEMETWMQKITEDIAEFCEPATSKRPPSTFDQSSGSDDNDVYDIPRDDSSPFDASTGPAPPVLPRSVSRRVSREAAPLPLPPPIEEDVGSPLLAGNVPPSSSWKQSTLDRGPPPLPPTASSRLASKPDSDDSADDYLELEDDVRRPPRPAKKTNSPMKRVPTRKPAGAVRMFPEAVIPPPKQPGPYRSGPSPSSPVPPPKPIPKPRVVTSKVSPPALPPKGDEDDDYEDDRAGSGPEDQYVEPEKAMSPTGTFHDVMPPSAIQSVSREEAERLVQRLGQIGVYLLRDSRNAGSEKVLTVSSDGKPRHFKVTFNEMGYSLQVGVNFRSLRELLHYYRKANLPRTNFKLCRAL
ncbi:SH3 domain-binding protein 2-like [Oscarella lobularis]|uniref:SH3 domain-binding protein 2-like n=1 Tax=Oscarella lobularis TaxID=121494 RepID=UPI0033139926